MSIIFFSILTFVKGQEVIRPSQKIGFQGAITDFFVDGSKVILASDAGNVVSYDTKLRKKQLLIKLPSSVDFFGDSIPTKIFSIDRVSAKMLVVTQGLHGFRNLSVFLNGESQKVIDAASNKMMIKKARWIDENTILLGLLGNDLLLFDTKNKKTVRQINVSPYTFSDFSIDRQKRFVFTADESGVVHQVDLKTFEIVHDYSGMNVDNVYELVYNNGIIITAGQDRRVGIYNTYSGDRYYLQQNFLVYAVGLSNDGTRGSFCASEDNNIGIFAIADRSTRYVLTGHESVVTKMLFFDNNTLVSGGDDGYLIIWKINN